MIGMTEWEHFVAFHLCDGNKREAGCVLSLQLCFHVDELLVCKVDHKTRKHVSTRANIVTTNEPPFSMYVFFHISYPEYV